MKHYLIQFGIIGLTIICSLSPLIGQDTVYLKKGSPITGKLIQYEIGGNLLMETDGGLKIVVPGESILSIVEGDKVLMGKVKNKKAKKLTPLDSDEWYFNWENKVYPNNTQSGIGVSLSYLYQWRHYLSAGVGVGYDNYNFNQSRSIVPVFAQVRSYLKDTAKSPYVDMKIGFGFSSSSDDSTIESSGGLYGQTSAGLRFGSGGFRTMVGLGLQVQNSYIEGFHPWNAGIVYEDRQYRRLVLNLGFIF